MATQASANRVASFSVMHARRLASARPRLLRPFATARDADAAAFARVVAARRSAVSFDPSRPLPPGALRAVLAATLRSPSGFNFVPWRLVLVDGDEPRARLAEAMVGAGNAERVREAPLSAVFLADLQSIRDVDAVVRRELAAGVRSRQYLRALPLNASLFAGGSGSEPCGGSSGLDSGGGCAAPDVGRSAVGAALSLGSLLAPLPTLPGSAEAWASKQVGLAAMSFLLAVAAQGLGAHAMEGLDARRVREAVGVPRAQAARWAVPLVVACGFERVWNALPPASTRPQPSEVFFRNCFGVAENLAD